MKLILVIVFFIFEIVYSRPVDIEDANVPEIVKATFYEKFKNPFKGKVEWSTDRGVFLAQFKGMTKSNPEPFLISCFIKETGEWDRTIRKFDLKSAKSNLPESVNKKAQEISKKNKNSKINILFTETKSEKNYKVSIITKDDIKFISLD
ncbi:MAG: hypothetical protein SFU98_20005 [Leptospiraceae bacterium]|nr:hypothetical protein [Leptospiraceae bacterium]